MSACKISFFSRSRVSRRFITRKYAYLVYYTVDDAAEEIIVLSVTHAAQRREHEDA